MSGQHAGDGLGPADIAVPVSTDTAMRATGRDTVTFAAIRDTPEKCQCGTSRCPDAPGDIPAPADLRVVLSCGPGVVSAMWRSHVRNGVWEDIRAVVREARSRVLNPASKQQERIHNDLDCDWHDIAAVFRADTTALTDPGLTEALHGAEGLHYEAELARQQVMHRESLERIAELRSDVTPRRAATEVAA